MLYTRRLKGNVITVVVCIAVLVRAAVIAGCGDGGSRKERGDVSSSRAGEGDSRRAERTVAVSESTTIRLKPGEEVARVPEPPKEVTYEEAEAAYNQRSYKEAVELFTLYTERRNANPWGYYMLGLSAWKAGDHVLAEEGFEKALELDGLHVKSWLNLGRVLLDMGRPDDALAKIDEALLIDPESNVAYRLRGRAYHQLGQSEEAVSSYRRAILIDNGDAWSMNNLGLVLIKQELFEEALPPLARAVELRDDVAVFKNNLGMAFERTGHFRAAEDAYSSAVAIDEAYEKAYMNLDRITAVEGVPSHGQVDLSALAQSFIDEISSWSAAEAAGKTNDTMEVESGPTLVGDASISYTDSTGNGPERD